MWKLITYFRKDSGNIGYFVVGLGLFSGLSTFALLTLINELIGLFSQTAGAYRAPWEIIALYGAILVISSLANRMLQASLIRFTQRMIARIRLRIIDRVRRMEFADYEKLGGERVYASLTRDAGTLSGSVTYVVDALTSAITIVFLGGYMCYLSPVGFAMTAGVILVALTIYYLRQAQLRQYLKAARETETRFFGFIKSFLQGFKELKMHSGKSRDLYDNHIRQVTEEGREYNTKANVGYLDSQIMTSFFLYLMIGLVIFLFPRMYDGGGHELVVKFLFVIMYIVNPITNLVNLIPWITQVNIAVGQIEQLDVDLSVKEAQGALKEVKSPDFESLRIEALTFRYPGSEGEESFGIGPVDLEVRKGDLVFIAGGNGSGKTTFFKLLTGLYRPGSGRILLNGEALPESDPETYRALFSPIFTDYYLFDRFYGLGDVDIRKVEELIKVMSLEEKVKAETDRFSQTDLSAGQKKRLALIIALLEHRPVLVLDEWAQDQDPEFRKFFYTEFLETIRKQGKTIIAITHDDHYFHVADRLYRMEWGKLREWKDAVRA